MSPTNLLSNSLKGGATLLGAVGIGAIALLGAPEAAKALDAPVAGTDYLITPADGETFYDFPFGQVAFKGVPTFPEGSDTVVKRLNDCVFDQMGMCEVDYIIEDLRLMSIDPVVIPGAGTYNAFVMLDDSVQQQPGTMKLGMDGSYSSNDWPVAWKTTFEPIGGAPAIPPVVGITEFDSVGTWTGVDGSFRLNPVIHQAPGHQHKVVPVPEPSATVPLALFGLAGLWSLKKKQSLN